MLIELPGWPAVWLSSGMADGPHAIHEAAAAAATVASGAFRAAPPVHGPSDLTNGNHGKDGLDRHSLMTQLK